MIYLRQLHRMSTCFDPQIEKWGAPLFSLFLRCYVSWQFLKSGWLKVQNWPSTLALFQTEYHVPFLPPHVAAVMGAGGELVFPSLLLLGLFSRPAAIGLFVVNAMAVISYPVLWEFECPAAINDHFYWGMMLVTVCVYGAGKISMDKVLSRRR